MKKVLVRYVGRVQGVGFRASVRQLAGSFKVSGWVKNLRDGGVELVVEAEAEEVDAFLKAIRDSHLGAYIDREIQEPCTSDELKKYFEIRL